MTSRNKLISLHSSDGMQQNGDFNSNVLFNFIDVIKRSVHTLYFSVYIQSAEIPYSFYNVSENYNTIYYNVSGYSYTMIIPEGNYTAKQFISEFQSQFSSGGHGKSCILTVSAINGKFNLKPSDDTFTITIYNNITTAHHVLGMSKSDHTFSYNSGNGITFDYPANLLGTTKIDIHSSALSSDNLSSHSLGNNNLIDTFSVNSGTFELINYISTSKRESKIRALSVQNIDIQLLDENHNFIDFNGLDWSLSLVITEYFNQNIIKPILSFDGIFDKHKLILEELKTKTKKKNEKKTTQEKNKPKSIDEEFDILTN